MDLAIREQSIDRGMDDGHHASPIASVSVPALGQRPRHFAGTDRRARRTPCEQYQRRRARIGHVDGHPICHRPAMRHDWHRDAPVIVPPIFVSNIVPG